MSARLAQFRQSMNMQRSSRNTKSWDLTSLNGSAFTRNIADLLSRRGDRLVKIPRPPIIDKKFQSARLWRIPPIKRLDLDLDLSMSKVNIQGSIDHESKLFREAIEDWRSTKANGISVASDTTTKPSHGNTKPEDFDFVYQETISYFDRLMLARTAKEHTEPTSVVRKEVDQSVSPIPPSCWNDDDEEMLSQILANLNSQSK